MGIKVSAEKKRAFEEELKYSKNEGRKEVVEEIQRTRAFGDLSENYEYKTARENQDKLEARIVELENILSKCDVYEVKSHYDCVDLGCTVTVEDVDTEKKQVLQIVGIYESDPHTTPKKISNEAPLGKALLGAKVDEEVDFEHKDKVVTYRIVSIK